MTPSQLRIRALKNLQSADKLIECGDTDNACNLAGQGVELALKARYCTRQAIADFPDTLAAIKSAGLKAVAIHDLDTLLTLSSGLEIPKYVGIDWKRVCEWDVAQRYNPVGTITDAQAKSRVEESRAVVELLQLHELLERLSHVRAELELEARVRFPFFLLDFDSRVEQARLIIGSHLIWGANQKEFFARLHASIAAQTDPDLISIIDRYVLFIPWNGQFDAYASLQSHNAFAMWQSTYYYGIRITALYLIPASGSPGQTFNAPGVSSGNIFM